MVMTVTSRVVLHWQNMKEIIRTGIKILMYRLHGIGIQRNLVFGLLDIQVHLVQVGTIGISNDIRMCTTSLGVIWTSQRMKPLNSSENMQDFTNVLIEW